MKKIIFFDIDGTLFNADAFIQAFYKNLTSKFSLNDQDFDEINKIYRDIKSEYGYFVPAIYLERITDAFPSVDRATLKTVFWGGIDAYLFEDVNALVEASEKAKIAFFSKGDEHFQKEKIKKFADKFEEKDVYVFSEKIDKFGEVFTKYKDYECYLVDDSLQVLEAAKAFESQIKTILIDRKGKVTENENIDFQVGSLSDIMPILNESR